MKEKPKPQGVIDFLIEQGIDLDEKKQAIIRDGDIDGEALPEIPLEALRELGFQLELLLGS